MSTAQLSEIGGEGRPGDRQPEGRPGDGLPEPAPRSAALYREACRVLPGGNTRSTVFRRPHPLYAALGEGFTITDVDGVRRIDFVNNQTSLIHGHAHPKIVAAAAKAIGAGSCFSMPTAAEIELAGRLVERCPTVEQVRFTNSGSEAVLLAIKAARALTGRAKIAKGARAYHGLYDHVEVSLEDLRDPRGAPQRVPYVRGTPQSVLDDTVVIPLDDPRLAGELLVEHRSELAALVIDPLPKRAGLTPLSDELLATIRSLTRELGIVLIVDEVISFRLGWGGAQERFGLQGDLTTFGKLIGGGFPVGAVGGSAEAMSVFDPSRGRPPVPHAGTFNANPVTMAAGCATLDLLDKAAFERLARLGGSARAALARALADAGISGCVTGLGSLFAIHLGHRPGEPCSDAERAALARLSDALLADGLLLTEECFGALSTPMGREQIERLVDGVRHGLSELAREGGLEASLRDREDRRSQGEKRGDAAHPVGSLQGNAGSIKEER